MRRLPIALPIVSVNAARRRLFRALSDPFSPTTVCVMRLFP